MAELTDTTRSYIRQVLSKRLRHPCLDNRFGLSKELLFVCRNSEETMLDELRQDYALCETTRIPFDQIHNIFKKIIPQEDVFVFPEHGIIAARVLINGYKNTMRTPIDVAEFKLLRDILKPDQTLSFCRIGR